MKFFLLLALISSQSFAKEALLCMADGYVFGMTKNSDDLYIGDDTMTPAELISGDNTHGRVTMFYDASTGEFSGGGEDGCVAVSYHTETKDGEIVFFETLDDEDNAVDLEITCEWVKY